LVENKVLGNVTGFWMIRHALVEENARARLYGSTDVPICETTMVEQAPIYQALADRLPRPADWVVTPLSRTHRTARAIFARGYPEAAWAVDPDLIEQDLGRFQGLMHADLPPLLTETPHAFWPLSGTERPEGGESMGDVIVRVGRSLERLAERHAGGDVVIVSHGGAIRAAVAHALRVGPDNALHLSVHNLSLTRLERSAEGWRVLCVNEWYGY
jgi:alpha-ribazole phosphatase